MIAKQRMVKRANRELDGWMTVGGAECEHKNADADGAVSARHDCAKKGVRVSASFQRRAAGQSPEVPF